MSRSTASCCRIRSKPAATKPAPRRTVSAGCRGSRKTQAAARRRQRLVAHVTVAAWPTEEQQQRLAAALTQKYSRQVRLAIDVDPSVLGGMRVQIGDDVVVYWS